MCCDLTVLVQCRDVILYFGVVLCCVVKMSEERARRLSQLFDPLARFTDHSGAGHSASTPNSPRLMPRRSREPPPPPPR